jgi:FkbH-like protein
MKLIEALSIIKKASKVPDSRQFHIICGFTALHLETFIRAYLQLKIPEVCVKIGRGKGDILQSLGSLPVGSNAVLFLEWFDIDQRLSGRTSVAWSDEVCQDIRVCFFDYLGLLENAIRESSKLSKLTVVLPILPVIPIKDCSPRLYSNFTLSLKEKVLSFANSISELENISIANSDWIHSNLPDNLYDFKSDIDFGFPYFIDVADKLACCIADIVLPSTTKKGIITDLDNTCWRGILGDDGMENISWTQADKAQHHGFYQQFLHSLSDSGVLVAIATKNNIEAVYEALKLPNIHLKIDCVFPIEANWGRKSESISKIIKAWNISPNDIIFVDDNELELEEVRTVYPSIKSYLFPKDNPNKVYDLVLELRADFSSDVRNDESKLRAQTLKINESIKLNLSSNPDDFIKTLNATLKLNVIESFSKDRCYELVNKTNQFNLNGIRYDLGDWLKLNQDSDRILVQIEYADKFGALGRISVISGVIKDGTILIDIWVLSCRAFSRCIEFKSLDLLIKKFNIKKLRFKYKKTLKNEPASIFFDRFDKIITNQYISIEVNEFYKNCPELN